MRILMFQVFLLFPFLVFSVFYLLLTQLKAILFGATAISDKQSLKSKFLHITNILCGDCGRV